MTEEETNNPPVEEPENNAEEALANQVDDYANPEIENQDQQAEDHFQPDESSDQEIPVKIECEVRDGIDPAKKYFTANFGPQDAGTQEEFSNFFKEKGINCLDVLILSHIGIARFETLPEVEQFISLIDGVAFNGVKLWAKKPKQSYVKTLHVADVEESGYSERKLYNIFAPYGFIRRISTRKNFTFVEFDTTKDANEALKHVKANPKKYPNLRVSYARSEHRIDTTNLSIPLEDIIPDSHPFWNKLQRMIYDHH